MCDEKSCTDTTNMSRLTREISSPSSVKSDQTSLLEMNEKIRNENNYTPSGEKVKSHGITFHDHVIMLYLCKFMTRDNFSFNLTCEVAEGGKFDDIIIFYEQDDRILCRMIQVKSKNDKNCCELTRHLLVDKNEPFNLNVYFLSYVEILAKYNFTWRFDCEIKDLILHTNISASRELKNDLESYKDDFFNIRGYYRLKRGDNDLKNHLVTQFLNSIQSDIDRRERNLMNVQKSQKKKATKEQDEEKKYVDYLKKLTVDEKMNYIDGFFETLKFHVAQPDKDELENLIKREIKRCLKKYNLENRLDSNQSLLVYASLYNRIYTFHSNSNVKILTEKQLIDWFKEANRSSTSKLVAFHDLNMTLLSNQELFITDKACETLKRQIESSKSVLLNIVANAGIVFTLIKLKHIFKNRQYRLITELQFLSISEVIEDDVDIEKVKYLIVMCEENTTMNLLFKIEEFLFRIEEGAGDICKEFKKLILVSKYNENSSNESYTTIIDETKWVDLKENTQKRLENNSIYLQGQEVKLADVDVSIISILLKNDILYDLVYSKLEIGRAIDSENTCNVSNFIERRICSQNKINRNIFNVDNENDLFVICNMSEIEFRQLELSSKYRLVLSGEENLMNVFHAAMQDNTLSNISLVRHENNEFFCIETLRVERIIPHVIGNNPQSIELHRLTSIEDRVVLIIAEPGMGKSDLLTVLAMRTIKEAPKTLTVKINLNNCTKQFNKMLEEKKTFREHQEAIDFIVETQMYNMDGYKSTFEKDYFKRHFNTRDGIFILVDGFDEIAPDYRDIVMDLIKVIKSINSVRLWLTSRPQEKKYLEKELNILSYALVKFTTDDQHLFFLTYWKRYDVGDPNNREERLRRFVERLINVTSKSLRDNDQLMTGIPLQCRMLGEVYQATFEEYLKSERDDVEAYLPVMLDILNLYEKFLEKKRIIYEEDKLKRDRTITGNKIHSSKDVSKFEKTHSYFALCVVFTKAHLDDILSFEDKNRIDKYVRKIESGEEKTGIITTVENGKPVFIHKTFAEYFAASWFYNRIRTSDAYTQILVDFFKKHFFKSEFETVRRFFDRMSAKGEIFNAVLNNDEKLLNDVLVNDPMSVNSVTDFDRNALHLCAAYEYNDLITILIEKHVKLTMTDSLCGWKPIEYACAVKNWKNVNTFLAVDIDDESAYEHMANTNVIFQASEENNLNLVKYLINHGTPVNSVNDKGETCLHLAARKGNLDICKYLVEEAKAAMDVYDNDGDTVLHYAARGGNLNIVTIFIEANSQANIVNKLGCSPLHSSAYFGHHDVFKYLIEYGKASIDIFDKDGDSVLHYAARGGNTNITRMLIEAKVDMNVLNEKKCTPLHSASFFGKYDVVKYLIKEADANIHLLDKDGDNVLHYAARGGNVDIAKLIIKANVDPNMTNNKGCSPVFSAAYFSHYEMFKYLIREIGVKIDLCDEDGDTLLHYISRGGNVDIAKTIPKGRLNFDTANKKGSVPLCGTAFFGHYDLFKYIVEEMNANTDFRDKDGDCILHYAARGGHINIVTFLIRKQFDVNITNDAKCTPLHSAAFFKQFEVFKYLATKTPADINARDADNDFVLHYAARGGNINIIRLLIEMNSDVNCVNNKMYTPLFSASYFGHHEAVKYLIEEAGAKTDIFDKDGDSVLHFACRNGNLLTVKILIENKLDVNILNNNGSPPVFSAAYFGKCDILEYFIKETNANINIRDKKGDTILHFAVRGGHIDAVKILVAEKLTIDVENHTGINPLDSAIFYDQQKVVEYFIETCSEQIDFDDALKYAQKQGKKDIEMLLLNAKLNRDIINDFSTLL